MMEKMLMSSASWYCSRVSDCTQHGIFCFGGRRLLYLVDITCDPPRVKDRFPAHQDRVVGVVIQRAFAASELETLEATMLQQSKNPKAKVPLRCCTVGEDKKVKMWDLEAQSLMESHSLHNICTSDHNHHWESVHIVCTSGHNHYLQVPTTIDWSPADPDLIVSAGDRGELVVWRPGKGNSLTYCPESAHIMSLACCPHRAELVSVGYKSGLILLVDISAQGHIVNRLRGIDEEVHSLSWCPVVGDVFSTSTTVDGEADFLLASGSRDAKVRVWSSQRGRSIRTAKLPTSRTYNRDWSEESARQKVWLTVYWPPAKPQCLLSSGRNGDLLWWDFEDSQLKPSVCRQGDSQYTHTRMIFNISCGGPNLSTLCTISLDRHIVLWDMERRSSQQCLTTLGGFVYCIRQSPINPGCIAVGTGDNLIRVWQVDGQSQPYKCKVLWQGIRSQVTSLAWHPTKEGTLAYGTDDGRVGIYDVLGNRGPQLSSTYHKKIVYVVVWGPPVSRVESSNQDLKEPQIVPDSVFVSGLPDAVSAESLASYFGTVGEIKMDRKKKRPRVWLYKDKETGRQKGEAMIAYVDPACAQAAVQSLNGSEFESCVLMVEPAIKKAESSAQGSGETFVIYSVGDGTILQHDPYNLEGNAKPLKSSGSHSASKLAKLQGQTEMSWNPEYAAFAIGHEDGTVEVWGSPSTPRLLCQITVLHSLVNHIAWHPQYTTESSAQSQCYHWLALGANEPTVHVCDLSKVVGQDHDSTLQSQPLTITQSVKQLQGHTHRVTDLAWSVHAEGRLVSVSYDATAEEGASLFSQLRRGTGHPRLLLHRLGTHLSPVWNAKTGEALANYRRHSGRLLSVQWSLLDSDLIFTAGEDVTVQSWRPSLQLQVMPPSASERKKRKKTRYCKETPVTDICNGSSAALRVRDEKVHSAAAGDAQLMKKADSTAADAQLMEKVDSTAAHAQLMEMQTLLEQKRTELLQQQGSGQILSSNTCPGDVEAPCSGDTAIKDETGLAMTAEGVSAAKKADAKEKVRKRRSKSLLPISNALDNTSRAELYQDCMRLTKVLHQGKEKPKVEDCDSRLPIFLNRRSVYPMVRKEVEAHRSKGNSEQQLILNIFQGSTNDSLTEAAAAGQLTDWHIAMAAMVSIPTWKKLCIAYGHQLESEGQVHKACAYLLAAQEVEEAINMLCSHNHFRDALCLAQLRLSKHDPLLPSIYKRWGDYFLRSGAFELAARCYVALGQPVDAARLLARRSDLPSLRAAADVCLAAGEAEVALQYAQKYVTQCLVQWDWEEARALTKHQNFKLLALITCVHELLTREMLKLGLVSGPVPQSGVVGDVVAERELLPRFLLAEEDNDPLTPWKPYLLENEALVHHIVRLWKTQHGLTLGKEELTELQSQLSAMKQAEQTQSDARQVLCQVATDVSLGLVQLLLGRTEMATNAWVICIATCYKMEQVAIAEGLCRLLLPQGPNSLPKLQNETIALRVAAGGGTAPLHGTRCQDPESDTMNICTGAKNCTTMNCLRAFYYCTVLEHLARVQNATGEDENDGQTVKEDVQISGQSQTVKEEVQMAGQGQTVTEEIQMVDQDQTVKEEAQLGVHGQTAQEEVQMAGQGQVAKEEAQLGVQGQAAKEEVQMAGQGQTAKGEAQLGVQGQTAKKVQMAGQGQTRKEEVQMTGQGQTGKEEVQMSEQGQAVKEEVQMGGQAARKEADFIWSDKTVCKFGEILLWDFMAMKYQLTETANQISQAVAAMVAAHGSSHKATNGIAADAPHDEGGFLPPFTLKPRRYSGEYLPMSSASATRRLSLNIPKPKPHERIPMSPIASGKTVQRMESSGADYVPMFAESQDCSGVSSHCPPTPSIDQVTVTDEDEPKGKEGKDQMPTCSVSDGAAGCDKDSETAKDSVGSATEDSAGADDTSLEITAGVESDAEELPKVQRSKQQLSRAILYEGLPDGWDKLPADVRYKMDGVTLVLLMQEQSRVASRLQELQHLQAVQFPDPIRSARLLLQVTDKYGAACSATTLRLPANEFSASSRPVNKRVASWALMHTCLTDDRQYFEMVLRKP